MARVVKTLNTVHVNVMVDPKRIPGPHNVFLSGDDPEAKAVVADILSEFGWRADTVVDLGGISTSRAVEMYASLFFTLAVVFGDFDFNIAIARRGPAPRARSAN